MNIFFVIDSLGAGGAERSTVEIARFLKYNEHSVTIVCLKHKKIGVEEEIYRLGVRLIYLSKSSFASRFKELKKLVLNESPDLIHSVLYSSNLLVRAIKLAVPSVKIVQSLVNTPYSEEREKDTKLPKLKFKIVKAIDSLSARSVDSYYHAITSTVLDHYTPLFKIPASKNFVIFRGRYENKSVNSRLLIREKLGFGNQFVFAAVGRQEFQKGHLLILKALQSLILNGVNVNRFKIVFLGREGEMSHEIKAFVLKNQLSHYVEFLGFRSDVEEILVASDAFLFPSYFEGLGGALIEALAAGLPVICSSIPVLKEVIKEDDGAVFVEAGNYMGLGNAMHRVTEDALLRQKLANHSVKRYKEAFQMHEVNSKMLEMYNHIIAH